MLIKRLTLKKLLSFNDATIELGPLNVLIGPNAVGKSNLIEAISLLQATPAGLSAAILRGGGVRQWLWLGASAPASSAEIKCEFDLPGAWHAAPVEYDLVFSEDARGFFILHELIAGVAPRSGKRTTYLERANSVVTLFPGDKEEFESGTGVTLQRPGESILAQFMNPADPSPVTELGIQLAEVRVIREFRTGPQSAARYGVSTSVTKDALLDGADNLALVLQELHFHDVYERKIRGYLRRFCERFEDVKVNVGEGLARTYLRKPADGDVVRDPDVRRDAEVSFPARHVVPSQSAAALVH